MSALDLGQRFVHWATVQAHVHALVQIGSQVRRSSEIDAADLFSDWDFQVISSCPGIFEDFEETAARFGCPLVVSVRQGRIGAPRKVTILFPEGELDIVVIPVLQFNQVSELVRLRNHLSNASAMRSLEDLASVLAGGYRILKGDSVVIELFDFIRSGIRIPHLNDADVRGLANGFVCDYVSTIRKIQRGEHLAAQRWLHHNLAEVNFRLAHELRQRAGLSSFPDARRVERLGDEALRSALEVQAEVTRDSLTKAAQKCVVSFRGLIEALLRGDWTWPQLPSNLSTE